MGPMTIDVTANFRTHNANEVRRGDLLVLPFDNGFELFRVVAEPYKAPPGPSGVGLIQLSCVSTKTGDTPVTAWRSPYEQMLVLRLEP